MVLKINLEIRNIINIFNKFSPQIFHRQTNAHSCDRIAVNNLSHVYSHTLRVFIDNEMLIIYDFLRSFSFGHW